MSCMSPKLPTKHSINSARCTEIDTLPAMSRSSIRPQASLSTLVPSIDTLLPPMVFLPLANVILIQRLISLGLRIMAFGVLYDFTGNSNVSKVIKAKDLVQESWFLDAINYPKPIDLFIVLGHNPVRTTVSSSTFGILYSTIRGLRPDVPIQGFGGHTHIRFVGKTPNASNNSLLTSSQGFHCL